MAGRARFKSLEWLDGESGICIADFTLKPPATNVETGELVSVARVARYPTTDGRGWYAVVSPVDDRGQECILHPWFAMALSRRLTNAEALARIGYTLETDNGDKDVQVEAAGNSNAGADAKHGAGGNGHRVPAECADPV